MKKKSEFLQKHDCPHGVFLGVGCTQCPKPEKEEPAVRHCLSAVAAIFHMEAKSVTDRVKRRRMQRDVEVLVKMRDRQP